MTLRIHPDYDINEVIASIVQKYGAKPSALIMILQDVQKNYNYLPKDALEAVAKKMHLPLAQIYGVATFYRTFSLEPKGKHHICVAPAPPAMSARPRSSWTNSSANWVSHQAAPQATLSSVWSGSTVLVPVRWDRS